MSTSTIPAYEPAVATRNLSKTYGTGEAIVHALNNVNIDFEYGKFTAIMGPSGSGKSTLMQTLATLDTPDRNPETIIRIGDTDLYGQKDNQLTEFRREHVGFIFQAFNLVPTLTAGQNIDLPLGLAGKKPDSVWRDYLVQTLGLQNVWITVPNSSPEVSNNASPSYAHYSPARTSSSLTNPPATLTPTRGLRFCGFFGMQQPSTSRPSSWSRTMRTQHPTQTAWSSSKTA